MAAIIDPVNSKSAAVTSDRKLQTFAIALDEATDISVTHGDYYLVCNALSGSHYSGSSGWALWMKNESSTQDCLIQNISISTNTNIYWHLGYGGTITGTPTSASIKNLNLGSSKVAPVTAYSSTAAPLSFSPSPNMLLGGMVLANTKWMENFNGSLVLGVNNSIGIYLSGGYSMAAIQFFMKDK